MNWKEGVPIFRQLEELVAEDILTQRLPEGAAVPSIRQMATDCELNPLTVSRAYQGLADQGFLEKRRGVGWFVAAGAQAALLARERADFLTHHWPAVVTRAHQLGLSVAELLKKAGRPA